MSDTWSWAVRYIWDGTPRASIMDDIVEALQSGLRKHLPWMKFVEFDCEVWSRSNCWLQCYKMAGTPVLTESVHFRMQLPDLHFFGGLDSSSYFWQVRKVTTRELCAASVSVHS